MPRLYGKFFVNYPLENKHYILEKEERIVMRDQCLKKCYLKIFMDL